MDLFNLRATLELVVNNFERGVQTAKEKMATVGESISKSSKNTTEFGKSLVSAGNNINSMGKTLSIVTVATGGVLGTAFAKAKSYIGTYESSMATFKHSSQIGEQGAQTLYNSLLGVAKNSAYAREHFLLAGQSLVAMGLSADDTTKYIQVITNTVAKMGGSGADIEQMADLFGKLSMQTNLYTNDINQMVTAGIPAWDILATKYHKSTDEVKQMARDGLIPAKESLDVIAGALDETSESSDMFKFSAHGMAQELKNGTLTGTLDSLNTSFRDFSLKLLDLDPQTDSGKANIEKLNGVISKFGDFLEKMGDKFGFVGDWIAHGLDVAVGVLDNLINALDNTPTWVLETIAAVLGAVALLGPLLLGVGTAIKIIGAAIQGWGMLTSIIGAVTGGIGSLNLAFLACPITWIIAGIVAVIAIFVLLWNNCEGFRNFWFNLWEGIKFIFAVFIEMIKEQIDLWIQIFKLAFQLISDLAKWFTENVWNNIVNWCSNVYNAISSKWNEIKNAISNAINSACDIVKNVVDRIQSIVSNVFNSVKDTVQNIWNGIVNITSNIWDNITGTISNAINNAKNIVSNVIEAIKGFFSFNIQWPHIPLPYFQINPQGWQIGDLLQGTIPSLAIDWHAKGGIFTKPTILSALDGLHGVGEAGAEAILPIETLKGYISEAMAEGLKTSDVTYSNSTTAKANAGVVNGLLSALRTNNGKSEINVYIGGKKIATELYEPLMDIMKTKEVTVGA